MKTRPSASLASQPHNRTTAEHEARGLAPRLRPSRVFHITLHYFGHADGAPRSAARRAGQPRRVRDRVAGVRPALRHLHEVGPDGAQKHPFVLTGGQGLEPVRALRGALAARLAAHGLAAPEGAYQPHLTLRYDKRRAPAWPVDSAGWTASEFVLVASPQDLTRHDILARWPLQG